MKNVIKSWKVITLLALGAISILGYAVRSRAFTLIEMQAYTLPYQFNATSTGMVTVTNVSQDKNLLVVIAIINSAGTVVQQGPQTEVSPGHTFAFPIKGPAGAVQFLRPVVTVNGAENFSSALIGLHVFNGNGQVVNVLPAVQFPFPGN